MEQRNVSEILVVRIYRQDRLGGVVLVFCKVSKRPGAK